MGSGKIMKYISRVEIFCFTDKKSLGSGGLLNCKRGKKVKNLEEKGASKQGLEF